MILGRRGSCSRGWLIHVVAALVALLATLLGSANASAETDATAETRVGASSVVVEVPVGPPESVSAGERLGEARPRVVTVVATGVAAKAVPETLNFGSRAAAREGLHGDLAAVGNRFFRGATGKSQDFQAVGLPGGGYRLQFFSPAKNPGYGKLYVQEIDRGGNIVRRYKDTIGPDGFIERKFVQ